MFSNLLSVIFLLRCCSYVHATKELSRAESESAWTQYKMRNMFLRLRIGPYELVSRQLFTIVDETSNRTLLNVAQTEKQLSIYMHKGQNEAMTYLTYIDVGDVKTSSEVLIQFNEDLIVASNTCNLFIMEPITSVTPNVEQTRTWENEGVVSGSGRPLSWMCQKFRSEAPPPKIVRIILGETSANDTNIPCYYESEQYPDESEFWPEPCVACKCTQGKIECAVRSINRQEQCDVLPCPKEKHRLHPNGCCPYCEGFDFCSLNPCDPNANCITTRNKAICRCKEGFIGDGHHCEDMDECSWDDSAKEQLGGCGPSTYCVNLPGSFRCDCPPGTQRLNERNCLELLRV